MDSPAPPPGSPPPASAAAAAALARFTTETTPQVIPHSSEVDDFNPTRQEKLPFHRLIDSDILGRNEKRQAAKTVQTLHTLLSNILNPPDPTKGPKYRVVRLANATIKRDIVDAKGAYDFLLLAGFSRTAEAHEEFLSFPSSPSSARLRSLRIAHLILSSALAKTTDTAERDARMKQAEMEVEKKRAEKALLAFEEDRRLRKEKDERESLARRAAAALPTPPATVRSTGPPPRQPRPSHQPMMVPAPAGVSASASVRVQAGAVAGRTLAGDEIPPAYSPPLPGADVSFHVPGELPDGHLHEDDEGDSEMGGHGSEQEDEEDDSEEDELEQMQSRFFAGAGRTLGEPDPPAEAAAAAAGTQGVASGTDGAVAQ